MSLEPVKAINLLSKYGALISQELLTVRIKGEELQHDKDSIQNPRKILDL